MCYIGVNSTAFGRKLKLFLAPSRFPAFHLKCPAFFVFRVGKNARFMRSDQHQLELRRLGNQLPVLGEANLLCDVGNISLQHTTRDINDSETVYFVIIRSQFARVMYLFVKLCVFSLFFLSVVLPSGEKNTNSRFLRFFVPSVPLFRSLMLTPMVLEHSKWHTVISEHRLCIEHQGMLKNIYSPASWISFIDLDLRFGVLLSLMGLFGAQDHAHQSGLNLGFLFLCTKK